MPMELAIEFFLVVCNLLINWTHSLRFFFGSVRFGWLFGQAKSLTAVARLSKLICVFAFCGMPPRRRRVLGTFPVRSFIYCLGACPARLAAHTHTRPQSLTQFSGPGSVHHRGRPSSSLWCDHFKLALLPAACRTLETLSPTFWSTQFNDNCSVLFCLALNELIDSINYG